MSKLAAAFIMSERGWRLCYPQQISDQIRSRLDTGISPCTPEEFNNYTGPTEPVEILFTGWGGPVLDEAFLSRFPRLKAVFHAAGSVRHMVTDAFWEKEILITSSANVNATFVADYCLAAILFSLKGGFYYLRKSKELKEYLHSYFHDFPGQHLSTIGLCSFGAIGKNLARKLSRWNFRVLVYDPYLSTAEAGEFEVEKVSLETLFREANLVSLHTPLMPETSGMISGELISSMQENAVLLNTARGGLIDMDAFYQVAAQREDIQFVFDVSEPEYPEKDHPIYSCENIYYTPHIAGAVGRECVAMGSFVIEELDRYLSGQSLLNEWNQDRVMTSA